MESNLTSIYEIRASKLDKGFWEIWHTPTGNRSLSAIASEAKAKEYVERLMKDNSWDNRRVLQAEIDKPIQLLQGMNIRNSSFDGWCVDRSGSYLAKGQADQFGALKMRRWPVQTDKPLTPIVGGEA